MQLLVLKFDLNFLLDFANMAFASEWQHLSETIKWKASHFYLPLCFLIKSNLWYMSFKKSLVLSFFIYLELLRPRSILRLYLMCP